MILENSNEEAYSVDKILNSTLSTSLNYKLEVKLLDGRAHVYFNDLFQFQFVLSKKIRSFTDSTQITVSIR